MPVDTEPKGLTAAQLRARLDARAQTINDRLATLRHELTTVADVSVAGQPLLDHVRRQPLRAAGLSLAGGLALGLLTGFRARARRRPPADERAEVLRLYVAHLLDAAAARVAKGQDADEAVEKAIRRKPPLVYYAPPAPPSRSAFSETFGVALKASLGFGVKTALDRLAQRITHEDELFEAIDRVKEDPAV